MLRQLLLGVLLWQAACIMTPLVVGVPRCFWVYTYRPEETIKLDIIFPRFNRIFRSEGFFITITDTNTSETVEHQATQVVWRHEFEPTLQHFYRVCYRLESEKEIGNLTVDFMTSTGFKVPPESYGNLSHYVKRDIVTNSTDEAFFAGEVADRIKSVQDERQKQEQVYFYECTETMRWIQRLSFAECVIFVVLAALQLKILVNSIKEQ